MGEKRAKKDALTAKKNAAHTAERKAKMLLKKRTNEKKAKLNRALTPVQRQAKKLVKHAVRKTQSSTAPHVAAHREIEAGTRRLRHLVAKVVAKSALTKTVAKKSVKKNAVAIKKSILKPKKLPKTKKKTSQTEAIVRRAIDAAERAKNKRVGAGKATAHAIKQMVAHHGK